MVLATWVRGASEAGAHHASTHFPPPRTKALSLRRLAAFEPILRDIAEGLVDAFAAKGRVELVEAFAIALPGNFSVDLLGLPREHLAQVNRWTTDSAEIFAGHTPSRSSSSTHAGSSRACITSPRRSRTGTRIPATTPFSDIVTGAAPQ
jgi:cytochrome P450